MSQTVSKQNGEAGASSSRLHPPAGDGADGGAKAGDMPRATANHGAATDVVRAALLLAGSVRTHQWRKMLGRFFLNLPVSPQRSVMDIWREQLTVTAQQLGQPELKVRVIVDRSTPLPEKTAWHSRCSVGFEQDPVDYRGTGGLLSDLAGDYPDDDHLLVLYGAQVLFEPLAPLVGKLQAMQADVALACDREGSPLGVMLVRCGSLRVVPPVGYIDWNEQALPMIARQHDVRVWRSRGERAASIRTRADYLTTVRCCHERQAGQTSEENPYRETWRASYSLVEPGAEVAANAVIHDSVVLAGGRVNEGATLVRSLVCSGGVVPAGRTAVERIVNRAALPRGRSRGGRHRGSSRGRSREHTF